MKPERIGRYRVYFWNKLSPAGHDGWVVQTDKPEGGLGEIISKHETKQQARAAAARYDTADIRRGHVVVKSD